MFIALRINLDSAFDFWVYMHFSFSRIGNFNAQTGDKWLHAKIVLLYVF